MCRGGGTGRAPRGVLASLAGRLPRGGKGKERGFAAGVDLSKGSGDKKRHLRRGNIQLSRSSGRPDRAREGARSGRAVR